MGEFGALHRAMTNARTNSELTSLKRIVQKGQIPDADWPNQRRREKEKKRRQQKRHQKGVATFGSHFSRDVEEANAEPTWKRSRNRLVPVDSELAGKLRVLSSAARSSLTVDDSESDFDREKSVY